MTSGIYKFTQRDTGRIYVGSTVNIHRRLGFHLSLLRKGNHSNRKLQADANEFGVDSFEFAILEVTPNDESILNEREEYWRERLKSDQYYNRQKLPRKGLGARRCRICGGGHYARDLCSRHYQALNKAARARLQ